MSQHTLPSLCLPFFTKSRRVRWIKCKQHLQKKAKTSLKAERKDFFFPPHPSKFQNMSLYLVISSKAGRITKILSLCYNQLEIKKMIFLHIKTFLKQFFKKVFGIACGSNVALVLETNRWTQVEATIICEKMSWHTQRLRLHKGGSFRDQTIHHSNI